MEIVELSQDAGLSREVVVRRSSDHRQLLHRKYANHQDFVDNFEKHVAEHPLVKQHLSRKATDGPQAPRQTYDAVPSHQERTSQKKYPTRIVVPRKAAETKELATTFRQIFAKTWTTGLFKLTRISFRIGKENLIRIALSWSFTAFTITSWEHNVDERTEQTECLSHK